jgi:hypothetical protein
MFHLTNPEQYRCFVDMSREVKADQSPAAMERAFELVVKPKKTKDRKAAKRE